MQKFCVLILFAVIFSCSQNMVPALQISDQRTEYMKNPLGVDEPQPRFTWIAQSIHRGVMQDAYQVLVSSNREALAENSGDMWDTGKVDSDRSVNVSYEGGQLESDHTYYWKVRIWANDTLQSDWSEPATFHTGLFAESDWQGEWIGTDNNDISAPLMRNEFSVDKEIESAHAFISGLGYYELYLNGEKVGDHVIDPGETEYGERVLYSTYDVTGMLQQDENAVGIMLGNGQFHIEYVENRYNKASQRYPSPYGRPRAILQLNIKFSDGTTQSIVTDDSWKVEAGPIVFNNFYGGEDYDARKEQPGWKSPGFDDSAWADVDIMDEPAILDSQVMPPMKIIRTMAPIRETQSGNIYMYDLGQNIIGFPRIEASAPEGTTIRIRCSETLNNEQFPRLLEEGDSMSTMHDFHRDVWFDYTFKGEGTESYQPYFFFTGFRYIEVTVPEGAEVQDLQVRGQLVHTAVEHTGEFSSSNAMINRIHDAAVWAQRGNMSSIPTDCPQREKWGWTADAHLYMEEANHNFDMPSFWTKWLNDFHDAQQVAGDGAIPDVVPNYTTWRGSAPENWDGAGTPAWGSAYALVYWYMYKYYEDTRILERHYEGVKAWTDYLTSTAEDGLIRWGRGDWGAPGPDPQSGMDVVSPVPLTSSAYYYKCADIVAQAADILGKQDEAQQYAELRDQIRDRFNQVFFSRSTNQYAEGSQTSNAVPLDFGIVEKDRIVPVLENLIQNIEQVRDGHFYTGILGTKALINILPEYGFEDLLFQMTTETSYPGYGFWMENNATALWEFWSGLDSHNHAMFGTIEEFFYNDLAGIKAPVQEGTETAYRHIFIEPNFLDELDDAGASIETVRGAVSSIWERTEEGVSLGITIPVNATATVRIPVEDMEELTLREGDDLVWQRDLFYAGLPGISSGEMDRESLTLQIGSGEYFFRLTEG